MLHNTRKLIIKDYSKLEEYGFVKQGNNDYYFFSGNTGKYGLPSWTIHIRRNDTPYITSHGNVTLETICKMYVDGVIAFENNNVIERKKARIKKLEEEIARLKKELE